MYLAEPRKSVAVGKSPERARSSADSGPITNVLATPIPDVLRLGVARIDLEAIENPFPRLYENSATKRIFRIDQAGTRLAATQIQGDPEDPHSGMARYSFSDDSLVLEHIESDPEEGSGIGAVLMFCLAQIALENDKFLFDIAMPAATAVGFYEKMGAASIDTKKAAAYEERLQQDDEFLEDRAQLYVRERARLTYNTNPENRRIKKRSFWTSEKTRLEFGALSQSEQTRLINAEKAKFRALPRQRKYEIARTMAHHSAISKTLGMRAKSEDVMVRAAASMEKPVNGTPLWNDLT